jgi:Na+:H+ antiporter, NhaA family
MLVRFFRSEPAAAIVLLLAAVAALIVANSPLGHAYEEILGTYILGISVHHWINDALMAAFFLLVGMEIKQEVLTGALSSWRARILPGIAAVGGMAMPALIFVLVNRNDEDHLAGWAIPAATDIAFAMGVLAILGPRVPIAVRVLLVGIAIIDDLLAIVVIALFYTSELQFGWLAAAGVASLALVALNRRSVLSLAPYIALGIVLWYCVYQSGVHATLAGVVLALAIPARSTSDLHRSPMQTTEHAIDKWVNFGILPLFGFANAGVSFSGLGGDDIFGSLPLGIALGLFVGKQVGIFGTVALAIGTRIAERPVGVSWAQLYAMAILCGIGFTMSLFIGGLAFEDAPALMDQVKVGVIAGSVVSAIIGAVLMTRTFRPPEDVLGETVNANDIPSEPMGARAHGG